VAQPGPLRALERARLDVALRAAAPDRLRPAALRDPALPPAAQHHPRPPRARDDPRRRDHHRAARAGLRQRRGLRPGRADPCRALQPAGPRGHRPPHVVHVLRRGPHGGHLPRGGEHRRPPRARAPRRHLRRQQGEPRRPHEPELRRGRARALRGLRVAGAGRGGRQRPRRPRARLPGGRVARRAAHAHRLPHPHRVRLAAQAGQLRLPRLGARRGRGPRHQGGLRVARGRPLPHPAGGRRLGRRDALPGRGAGRRVPPSRPRRRSFGASCPASRRPDGGTPCRASRPRTGSWRPAPPAAGSSTPSQRPCRS
jgi:hypothetical protein